MKLLTSYSPQICDMLTYQETECLLSYKYPRQCGTRPGPRYEELDGGGAKNTRSKPWERSGTGDSLKGSRQSTRGIMGVEAHGETSISADTVTDLPLPQFPFLSTGNKTQLSLVFWSLQWLQSGPHHTRHQAAQSTFLFRGLTPAVQGLIAE